MRNNETGEFELVVGNRQLLSGFAIVVLLFGVGVAMGYILGQNSPKSAKLQPDATTPPLTDPRPQPAAPVTPPPQPTTAAAPTTDPSAQPAAAGDEGQGAPATQPATQPARESGAAAAPPPAAAASTLPEPPPGSYWQVMALPQADAEGVVRTLKDQGFPALLSPGTKNLTRVLVGPFKDTQSMGKAKTQLESAGFHPVKKSSE
jgi:hypothetical protein